MKKGIIYINQFFAGIGGENMADFEPEIREGVIGSGLALKSQLKDVEITHTIICGDNFMGSKTDEAIEKIMKMLEGKEFDFFFAGPAFQAGRYGVACGTIAKVIKEKYNIPVFSSMHIENPGVEMFKKDVIIFNGGGSAASMRANSKVMADYVNKICSGEKLGTAKEEQYFGRSIRHQTGQLEEREVASKRVVSMLLKKLAGEHFETELPIPKMERVEIAAPIRDLSKAKVALVTTGGIVPVANPDRIQSASATRWGMYDISGIDRLEKGIYKTIHAGYDPAAADNDPNVCVPLDALRAYEKEGKIGAIDTHFYTTVGTGTTEAEATRMAEEMVIHLRDHNVDGIIMTST